MGQPSRNRAKVFYQNTLHKHKRVLYGPLQPLLTPWCRRQRLGERSAVQKRPHYNLPRNKASAEALQTGAMPLAHCRTIRARVTDASCCRRRGWVVGKESLASRRSERLRLGLALVAARFCDLFFLLLFPVAMAPGGTERSSLLLQDEGELPALGSVNLSERVCSL